ncbi:YegS/Rv2252/BmrU family lipid kinase [Oceanobacillus manasiensis]|uniref:YegS/Rv2252/BmrU family lipid kinase n=1 Tax=Oceanobacillus manasiensis TaxID=586413 RepID=UPI0005AA4226|nr:YegS/Rv2252/BmrU family lipid kinase [Oceanobacillus manasiensis]
MPRFTKALLLYNGNAGRGDIEQKLSDVLPILSRGIKELIVLQTASKEEVTEVCKKNSDQVELLIILGGDGTLHCCINALAPLPNRPIIAVLPGGTSNDFSRMLEIPQNLSAAAEAIIEGKVLDIDVAQSDEKYFLNFWGIGMVADTSKNIDDQHKKSFGVLSYFMSTLKTVSQSEQFTYKIETKGEVYEGEAVVILFLNGTFIGTRQIPVLTIDPTDGYLDVLIVKNSSIASFRELLSMSNAEVNKEALEQLIHFQADEIKINTGTAKEIDMDGEISTETPADIRILPKHIQMIQAQN